MATNSVRLDKRRGIVELVWRGNQTAENIAQAIKESLAYNAVLEKAGKPVLSLNDVSLLGSSDYTGRSVALKGMRAIRFERLALFGASLFWKQILKFLVAASGKGSRIKHFDHKSDATRWLMEARHGT